METSGVSSSSVPVQANVRLIKGAGKELATVVNTILQGVEQTSQAIDATRGQLIDVVA